MPLFTPVFSFYHSFIYLYCSELYAILDRYKAPSGVTADADNGEGFGSKIWRTGDFYPIRTRLD